MLAGVASFVEAQPVEKVSGKKAVVVDYFSRSREIPYAYMEAIRGQVMAGFENRGRHNIIDVETLGDIDLSQSDIVTHPKSIIGEHHSSTEQKMDAIYSLGVDYIISGVVSSYDFKHKDKNSFTSNFIFSLISLDTKTGKSTSPEEFRMSGYGSTPEESDRKALERIPSSMLFYIDNHFKFQTEVLRIEPPVKGKYKELYIHSGSDMGIQNGDLFEVFQVSDINDVPIRTKIGKIRAKETCGEEVTRCSIKSGGKEMFEAMSKGDKLTVVSAGQAFF